MRLSALSLGLLVFVTACTTAPPVPKEKPREPVAQVPEPKSDVMAQLGSNGAPERDLVRDAYRFDRTISMGRVPGVRLYTYEPGGAEKVVGFALVDRGSKRINPRGLKGSGARREFLFQFPDRARKEEGLMVLDDVRLSKRYSHDNMFRELHSFGAGSCPRCVAMENASRYGCRPASRCSSMRTVPSWSAGCWKSSPSISTATGMHAGTRASSTTARAC